MLAKYSTAVTIALVAVVACLAGALYVQNLKLDAARADKTARTYERDEALAANRDFTKSVDALRADIKAADSLNAVILGYARYAAEQSSSSTLVRDTIYIDPDLKCEDYFLQERYFFRAAPLLNP